MSDYARRKVIRCRVTEPLFGTTNPYEVEEKFEDLFNETKQKALGLPYFEPAPTEEPFIDLMLFHSYGKECGDFGHARRLSSEEAETFLPYFKQLSPDITADQLRYVDFCWYNCTEAPDYFEEDKLDLSEFPRL